MPTSPYIEELKRTIAASSDLQVQGVTKALLAACYARHGDFEMAEAEIGALRAAYGDGRSGRVSVMIMCAEAQLIYYKDLGEKARDRMLRAQVLSVAARDASLSALTSAWLAHICFNLHRHEEMARAARTAIDTLSSGDHEAASRLALTLGDAFCAANQPEVANGWYAKAHGRAVRLKDHSTVAALTYNRAAMSVFRARLLATESSVDPRVLALAEGEMRTAVNYQAIAQLTSLQPLLDYSVASVNLLRGKFQEATVLLTRLIGGDGSTSPLNRSAALQCDLAYCLANMGDLDGAREQLIGQDRIAGLTADDQVVALHALRIAASLCLAPEYLTFAEEAILEARSQHKDTTTALQRCLAPFADPATLSRL